MASAISWFEIPVVDFERGKKFYESILEIEMQGIEAMGMQSAFFPVDFMKGEIGGCIIKGEGYSPSSNGPVVYLNGGDDLSTVLDRVEAAGGNILLPKTPIGENGFMAYFGDTEGNKIGLHSRQ